MSTQVAILLAVPLVTALAGWLANRAVQWMFFHPVGFVGVGRVGWQGVLPRRAQRFAQEVAGLLVDKLLSPRELARRIDVAEVEKLLERTLDQQTRELTREAAELIQPGAWAMLPAPVQAAVESQLREQARGGLVELFTRMQDESQELLDYRGLVAAQLSNTDRLARLTLSLAFGRSELRLIGVYGAVFGLISGLAAAGAWLATGAWWLVVLVAGVVGLATNWLSLQMIFRPHEPRRFFGLFTYQGLFPRRQNELARDYGRITAEQVLTPANLTRLVTDGEAAGRFAGLLETTVRERMTREFKKIEPLVPFDVKPEAFAELTRRVCARTVALVPYVARELAPYLGRKLDIAGTIERRLAMLSKPEFERVLRGLFVEDERMLIGVGGFLGVVLGFAWAAWAVLT